MENPIRVGIIGASVNRGWAQIAHVPALAALPEFGLRAISTRSQESAERSARIFGVPLAFDNHQELLAQPDIDLAVVSVHVLRHREIALAAIAAGKMVYCEWPLGRNLAEAREIAAAARERGVRTIVGLQGRMGPAVRYVRDLIADGYVGRPLSTAIIGAAPHEVWAGVLDEPYESHADPANGATLLTIPAAHALDMLAAVLGDFETVSATMIAGRKTVLRVRDQTELPNTSPDTIAITGMLTSGAFASFHYHGGQSASPDFTWEITGTDGSLALSGDGFANMASLRVTAVRGSGDKQELAVPDTYRLAPQELGIPADNVAALYRQFAVDLSTGTTETADFEVALRRHHLIEAIERSNAEGRAQSMSDIT